MWAKSDLPIINSVCKKAWFTINGLSKYYFWIFTFFIFPKLKWPLLKILWKKHPFLLRISRVIMKFYYVAIVLQWNNGSFKLFWNLHGNAFPSFIFLNKRNIATSLLMIHLKCTVVHYANLNSSSINKPYLRRHWICYFFFFNFLFMFILKKLIFLSFFNGNFENSFQVVVYYRILGCQTLWY